MSRKAFALALASIATLSVGSVPAQQSATALNKPAQPTGSLMGYVMYAENQLPARFAEIRLVPKPANLDFVSFAPLNEKPLTSGELSQKKAPVPRLVVGSTGMDGTFRLDSVPIGDYFAAALKPGYVTPGAGTQMDASEDQLKSIVASLSVVHVGAGQVATLNLILHRGAVISGRMQYADGSPAIGAPASVEPPENLALRTDLRHTTLSPLQDALQSLTQAHGPRRDVLTNDEGRYRIFGLPPGKYVVTTMLGLNQSSAQVFMDDGSASRSGREHLSPEIIAVYAPGTFRQKDAKVFEIRRDEQITDADLTVDPAGLRTLRGRVLAAEDHHVPTGAMVRLREDGAKDVGRFVEIEDDGSFQIDYLPSGNYKVGVEASDFSPSDAPGAPQAPRFYKTVKLAIVVRDQDVVLDDIMMTALKPGEKDLDFDF